MQASPVIKQIQFNKGIKGLPDKLTVTIMEEAYYLRIKIIDLVFTEGAINAPQIVIDIIDKDKLHVADYLEGNQVPGLKIIHIYKDYEFVTSSIELKVDDNQVSKFNFFLTYKNINV
jgi:hypothetical protein